jgi:hypothetical protein
MFIYVNPTYPRTSWERAFKQLYNFGLIINFAAFIITLTSFYERLDHTFIGYFDNTNFELATSLKTVLTNCTYSAPITIHGATATTALTLHSLPFMFLTTTHSIVAIFAMHLMLIVIDFACKMCFSMNVRHLRYKGFHMNIASLLSYCVGGMSIIVITLIAITSPSRKLGEDYVKYCAQQYLTSSKADFVKSESSVDVVFGLQLNFLLAGVVINMIFYFFAFLHYVSDSTRRINKHEVSEQYPWERGFLCRPNKPILIAVSKLRRENDERLKNGEQPLLAIEMAPTGAEAADMPRRKPQQQYSPDGGLQQEALDDFDEGDAFEDEAGVVYEDQYVYDEEDAARDQNREGRRHRRHRHNDSEDEERRDERRRHRRHRRRERRQEEDDAAYQTGGGGMAAPDAGAPGSHHPTQEFVVMTGPA